MEQHGARIAGTEPGTGHDLVLVEGTAALAGSLFVDFLEGYDPPAGSAYTILVSGALSGEFDYVSLGGVTGQVTYTDTGVVIEVEETSDVSDPEAEEPNAGSGFSGRPAGGLSAWPNPTYGRATVEFEIPRAGHAQLTLHDLSGRVLRTLSSGSYAAGSHRFNWDGLDGQGRRSPSGWYLFKLSTGSGTSKTRLLLLR